MKKDGFRAQACYRYKAPIIISLFLNESNLKKMQSTVGSYARVQVP